MKERGSSYLKIIMRSRIHIFILIPSLFFLTFAGIYESHVCAEDLLHISPVPDLEWIRPPEAPKDTTSFRLLGETPASELYPDGSGRYTFYSKTREGLSYYNTRLSTPTNNLTVYVVDGAGAQAGLADDLSDTRIFEGSKKVLRRMTYQDYLKYGAAGPPDASVPCNTAKAKPLLDLEDLTSVNKPRGILDSPDLRGPRIPAASRLQPGVIDDAIRGGGEAAQVGAKASASGCGKTLLKGGGKALGVAGVLYDGYEVTNDWMDRTQRTADYYGGPDGSLNIYKGSKWSIAYKAPAMVALGVRDLGVSTVKVVVVNPVKALWNLMSSEESIEAHAAFEERNRWHFRP